MRNALSMTPRNRRDELSKVEMRHVFAHSCVCFDLVEQVAAFSELECQPDPSGIFTMSDVANDVLVWRNVGMEGKLDLKLTGAESSGAEGVVFVDELDGDDGPGGVRRDGFADAIGVRVRTCVSRLTLQECMDVRGICAGTNCLGDNAER